MGILLLFLGIPLFVGGVASVWIVHRESGSDEPLDAWGDTEGGFHLFSLRDLWELEHDLKWLIVAGATLGWPTGLFFIYQGWRLMGWPSLTALVAGRPG